MKSIPKEEGTGADGLADEVCLVEEFRRSAEVRCPICYSQQLSSIGCACSIDDARRFTVEIWRCQVCGHWATTPRPAQSLLDQLYKSGSRLVLGDGWENEVRDSWQTGAVDDDHWVARALVDLPVGNVLDVGPGGGALLRMLEKRGWDCRGVDPGGWSGAARVVSRIQDLPRGYRADVVILHDVLEHVNDPRAVLQDYSALLRPRGRVVLAFPRSDSLDARLLGVGWPMVRPLGHLHYFSHDSAVRLVASAGLTTQLIEVSRVQSRAASLVGPLETYAAGPEAKMPFLLRLWSRVVGAASRGDQLHVVAAKPTA